jgi:hypothetical protein
MSYAIKVRAHGAKQYRFLTPAGETTTKKVHAAANADLLSLLGSAAQIRDENPTFDVIVVNFDSGDEVSKMAIKAAQDAADSNESPASVAANEALVDVDMTVIDHDLREDGDSEDGEQSVDPDLLEAVIAARDANPKGWDETATGETDHSGVLDEDSAREYAARIDAAHDDSAEYDVANDPLRVILVTSAPEEYDGFGTVTLAMLPWLTREGGYQYRRVSVNPEYLDWQQNRYASGMMGFSDEEHFNEIVSSGLLFPLVESAGEASAAGASAGEPSADMPTSELPEDAPKSGEVYKPLGVSKIPHVIASVTLKADGYDFTSVCGKPFTLGDPAGADDAATICDYCFMGVKAPAADPEPVKAAPRVRATVPSEPEFRENREQLHGQNLALAQAIIASNNRIDAQAMLSDLRTVMELLRANLPKAAARAAISGDRAVYVRMQPSGAKTVTVGGTTFDSMAKAATHLASTYKDATACQTYVARIAKGQTANARDYITRDRAAGRIPAGVVVFSDDPEQAAA